MEILKRIVGVACLLWVQGAFADYRIFTDTEGREVEAQLLGVDGAQVHLRIKPSGEYTLPMDTFSRDDREYIRMWRAFETIRQQDKRKFGDIWPESVSVEDVSIEEIENEENDTHSYRSDHFQFTCEVELPLDTVRQLSRVFEATYELVKSMPMQWNPIPPDGDYFIVSLYASYSNYIASGAPVNSGGYYSSGERMIHVPLRSLGVERTSSGFRFVRDDTGRMALDTVSHEVTHQVTHPWLFKLPIWLLEGTAEFTAAIPYRNGTFRLDLLDADDVLKNASQLKAIRDVESLMTMTIDEWALQLAVDVHKGIDNYRSSLALAYYFFKLDGEGDAVRIRAYLRAIAEGESAQTAVRFLLDGRTYDELQQEVMQAINGY